MSAWWWVALVVAVTAPALVYWSACPWERCRPCDGNGTLRDPWTRRFTGHCRDCLGHGQVERTARRAVRSVTGGVVFPGPPERPYDGQMFGTNVPFSGGGRRARRRRQARTRW